MPPPLLIMMAHVNLPVYDFYSAFYDPSSPEYIALHAEQTHKTNSNNSSDNDETATQGSDFPSDEEFTLLQPAFPPNLERTRTNLNYFNARVYFQDIVNNELHETVPRDRHLIQPTIMATLETNGYKAMIHTLNRLETSLQFKFAPLVRGRGAPEESFFPYLHSGFTVLTTHSPIVYYRDTATMKLYLETYRTLTFRRGDYKHLQGTTIELQNDYKQIIEAICLIPFAPEYKMKRQLVRFICLSLVSLLHHLFNFVFCLISFISFCFVFELFENELVVHTLEKRVMLHFFMLPVTCLLVTMRSFLFGLLWIVTLLLNRFRG